MTSETRRSPLLIRSMDGEAAQLRLRATELRRVAAAIEAATVMTLDRDFGDETAIGPRFDYLRERIRTCQHDLYGRAEDLRWTAYRLEQRADELDATAAARAAALAASGAC